MNRTEFIQKRLAFFLLLVFALGTTPKTFFHDALIHHKDGLICRHTDKQTPCFHQQSFHCAFDDLVVTAPYLAADKEPAVGATGFFAKPYSFFSPFLLPVFVLHAEDRGPPVG